MRKEKIIFNKMIAMVYVIEYNYINNDGYNIIIFLELELLLVIIFRLWTKITPTPNRVNNCL